MRSVWLRSLLPISLVCVGLLAGCGPVDDDLPDAGTMADTGPSDTEPQTIERCPLPFDHPDDLNCTFRAPPTGCEIGEDCPDRFDWEKCPEGTAGQRGTVGCSETALDRIGAATITSPAGSCGAAGGGAGLRFTLVDDGDRPMGPESLSVAGLSILFEVQGESELVPLGEISDEQAERTVRVVARTDSHIRLDELGPENVALNDATLNAPPHRPCQQGSCQTPSYSCQDPTGQQRSELKRCTAETGATTESLNYLSGNASSQVFGVLVEHGASVQGVFPDPIGSLHYDADGDGAAEQAPSSFDEEIASDPESMREVAIKTTVLGLQQYRTSQDARKVETHLGLWTVDGSAEPTSFVEEATGSSWISDSADSSDGIEAGSSAAIDAFMDAGPSDERANIVEATLQLLEGPYADRALNQAEKTLVLVVDGPPERRSDRIDALVQKAASMDVRIFVVHYDPAIAGEKLRDDPAYFQPQSGECSGDADCRGWETCREIHGYHPQRGGDVTRSAGEYRSGTYCMVERDEEGRVGPVDLYGRLTCETGGGYYYRRASSAVPSVLEELPATMDGFWEASVTLDGLEAGQPSGRAALKVGGRLEVSTPGSTVARQLSLVGEGEQREPAAKDNRSVLFLGGE